MDDTANFGRQRRNVMWLAGSILFINFVGLHISDLSFYGLHAKRPQYIMPIIIILLIYSMWRYYQVSRENGAKDKIRRIKEMILIENLTFFVRQHVLSQLKKAVQEEVAKDANAYPHGHGLEIIYDGSPELAIDNGRTIFVLSVFGVVKWVDNVSGQGKSINKIHKRVVISSSDREFKAIHGRASYSVFFDSLVYTEYVLPYLMGCIALYVQILSFIYFAVSKIY